MRKLFTFAVVVCLVGLALPAAAQEEEPGTIGMIIRSKAKPGMGKQFEEGAKKHMEFHRQKGDTWTWSVWSVISGEHTGEYVVGSFGHKWADFDNMPVSGAEDEADAEANIGPYEESFTVQYINFMPKHSRPPEDQTPAKFLSLTTAYLKPGKVQDYLNAISKIPEALEKANSPVRYFFDARANGGRGPTFFIAFPHDSWADFAPPGQPLRKMLEEAYGPAEADSIMRTLTNASYGSSSEILRYRPDLSYVPD